jgi:hypothetical protein
LIVAGSNAEFAALKLLLLVQSGVLFSGMTHFVHCDPVLYGLYQPVNVTYRKNETKSDLCHNCHSDIRSSQNCGSGIILFQISQLSRPETRIQNPFKRIPVPLDLQFAKKYPLKAAYEL